MRKNRVRLTEAQLHRVIKESVSRILKEGNFDLGKYSVMLYDAILESYEAQEIAEDMGLDSEEEGAKMWFENVIGDGRFEMDAMPRHHRFVCEIDDEVNMYYDFSADYYFCVKER